MSLYMLNNFDEDAIERHRTSMHFLFMTVFFFFFFKEEHFMETLINYLQINLKTICGCLISHFYVCSQIFISFCLPKYISNHGWPNSYSTELNPINMGWDIIIWMIVPPCFFFVNREQPPVTSFGKCFDKIINVTKELNRLLLKKYI